MPSEPGSSYNYSNVGYTLLAFVVETASGLGYEQYLYNNLFLPADMYATGYVIPNWNDYTVAVGYRASGSTFGKPNEQTWFEDGPGWHLRGNGGILSTPDDMMRWHEALLDYGYGWELFPTVFDTQVLFHTGGNGTFFSLFIRFLEQDVTLYWASNTFRERDFGLLLDLLTGVFGQPPVLED